MHRKIKVITCCILLVAALAASFLKAQCVPQMPHRFYGYVTVAGVPAPDGTLVVAKISGITYASTTTVNGTYGYATVFNVPADDPDTPEKEGGETGDIIEFYVAGSYATSYPFKYGEVTPLNLTVAAPAPYADFTANVTTGYEPLTVEFTDQSKYFDSIESYTWDFGDGNTTVTTNPKIVHTYLQNGTYTVSLTVNGTAAGQVVVDTIVKMGFIIVLDTKPIANFYAEPTSGLRPLTVTFYDNSTSYDGIVAWEWDFGDGFTSNEQNPIHNYTQTGTFTVKLKVTETDGDISIVTKENYITVKEATPPTVTIINPTATNPTFTRSGVTVQVAYQYTEASPKNVTIKIYNSTHTIATATITDLNGGTNVKRTDNITIPAGTADGSYHLNVTIYNIYDLSATATQLDAVKVDNTKPEISNPYQDPPGKVVRPGETVSVEPGYNITVRVNVTEPNIEKVFLYYNVSATEWMKIQMTPTASGEYTATIPSSSYPPYTTIQYYIEALDKAGNTAQTPTEGVYFTTYIIPEYQIIILAALLPAIALITALNRKRKRNSS